MVDALVDDPILELYQIYIKETIELNYCRNNLIGVSDIQTFGILNNNNQMNENINVINTIKPKKYSVWYNKIAYYWIVLL